MSDRFKRPLSLIHWTKKRISIMGRKRTSNKRKVMISVDADLVDQLDEHNVNRSKLFTVAAKIFLRKKRKKNEKRGSQ